MGGEVGVESTPGAGSRFFFSVVFELSDEKCTALEDCSRVNPNAGRPTFTGKILLCEDNETNQLVAAENLKKLGFSVVIAANGKIAVDTVAAQSEQSFDIIFMDVHMPIMDGMQATRELIKMGVKTPIIAMTANAMKEAREECIKAGMSDYIAKPFRQRELWTCLIKYLEPVTVGGDEFVAPLDNAEQDEIIDKVAGLSYVGGSEKVYNTVLCRFLKEQPIMLVGLEQAIADKDYKLAHGLAHQMKGVAAMVGAIKLPEFLDKIEIAFSAKAQENYTDIMLTNCKTEFEKVHDVISAMNLMLEVPVIDLPFNKKKAIELISEIKPLLQSYKALNHDEVENARNILAPVGEKCELFITQLSEYDIEAALETLYEIEETIKTETG
jgi:CheY-like chemotaxis protein